MTERLADIGARIGGIRQLGAMEMFSVMLAAAIGRAFVSLAGREPVWPTQPSRLGLVLFCAEQGFASAFSERVL